MPFIELETAYDGPVKFNYHISTPAETSARCIDPTRPTILFIHGVFLAQETFIAQFNDFNLRRFNLIGLDLRSYGQTVSKIPDEYGPTIAAQDVSLFMDALQLPPCHIFGLSMGSIVALQLAIDYPDSVSSLFLLSPLGLAEPEEVAEGRREACEAWVEGCTAEEPDEELMHYGVSGGLELVCKDRHSNIMEALVANVMQQVAINWNKDHIREYRITTLDFIVNRKARTKEELSKIKVPVKLVHCMGDVAYPIEYTTEFFNLLKEAGVDASLDTIPEASHFGCCEDAHQVNPILHNFIMANTKTEMPAGVEGIHSPWNEILNWRHIQNDSDDELIFL
ncbi:alpha/beta-hydrolase [Lentinula aciculospora]|uniref:Alpha/beta-hydrolase n=1 Tax=Lentinula aciculospora TaxID=153920 RepID=A0A9W9AVM8_9AGAR|nr:alpha/beta-hydrolase [Lentinula aciculospora]